MIQCKDDAKVRYDQLDCRTLLMELQDFSTYFKVRLSFKTNDGFTARIFGLSKLIYVFSTFKFNPVFLATY